MSQQNPVLYWEDIQIGRVVPLGERTVTREEIIAFAAEFDPQPFHLDEMAAKDSLLQGLAASGWHTCALLMRMICDGYLSTAASHGSPGLDEVKWLKPVRPGDTLRAQFTCTRSRLSKSRPGVGICHIHYELFNQHGDKVMTWDCNQFFGLKSAGSAS